ncbi:MAG: pre-peptidase [Planctomycetes bacterium]|nr:pre-peptidase [Planctomycetota bacterium]
MPCLLVPAVAEAAAPTLSHLFPAGGQRGTKVIVTCSGKFDWPPQVFAPGLDVKPTADAGKLEVTIPADLPADRAWLRLYNAEGASASVPFLIGTLPEVAEQEPNNTLKAPQAIADPKVTINGVLAGADVDGYAVTLQAGQTLVAALDANTRLGSPMDAILQIATPDGIVVAENHDDLGLDPRLAYTARQTGSYIVRLFAFPSAPDTTIAFRGGDNYVYRLTLTTGPYLTHTLPLTVSRTAPEVVEAQGWNIPAGTKLPAVPFGGARLADFPELEPLDELRKSPDSRLAVVFDAGLAGTARVRQSPFAVAMVPATQDPANPPTLPVGSAATGCLRAPKQKDTYRLPLQKGQHVIVSLESQSLDLPVDPLLQLVDPKGAVVAEVDDAGALRDAVLSHVAAQDGEYRIVATDRFGHGGPRFVYLLTARLEEPDFELSIAADSLTIPADKPAELAVKIIRRKTGPAVVGPITIQPRDLPAGITAPAVTSEPTGPSSEEVKLTFTGTGAAYSGPLRIVGTATQPKELTRLARVPAKLGVSFDTLWLTSLAKP